jgi:membrane associated rhomboid family serine protease
VVTLGLVGLSLACFLFELSRGGEADLLLRRWGVVPADVLGWPAAWVTLITSLFLHAGWLHLASNGVYLWVFGMGVERRLGAGRYLLLYLASGIVGGLAYVVAQPTSEAPAVGASGAIAGVIAANLVLQPSLALGSIAPALFIRQAAGPSLPALVLLLMWLLTQLFSGVASITTTTGIAWWAHLGGFASGLVLTRVLWPRGSRR